jgi:hypothetical protein
MWSGSSIRADINSLRGRGSELAAQRRPWFLAVSLIKGTTSCS